MIYGAPIRLPGEFLCPSKSKEVSVSIDRLKTTYIPKELEDFPVEVKKKKKSVPSTRGNSRLGRRKTQRKFQTREKKSPEKASRQETTTLSSRRVCFNQCCQKFAQQSSTKKEKK
ncbi:hypothetical protein TNCT_146321 [Trichonephila clavata]|uniref:Uncharacterized protein n=1 Tax=Trichonephila clavata TaxID=2740835 RepID=A0A8X6LM60_TRICU|nr:hypothetical protein TNCT_146321 [Trichonephila clavata]